MHAGRADAAAERDQRRPGVRPAVPSARNHAGPWRATSARCASVSAFWTSVGRRPSPRSDGRGGLTRRDRAAPLERLDSAVSSPVRNASGTASTRTWRPSPRSAIADAQRGVGGDAPRAGTATTTVVGPDRDGGRGRAVEHEVRDPLEQHAVLRAHGLALGAVDDDDACGRGAAATARSLAAVGKAAPPRPRSPACSQAPIEVGRAAGERAVQRDVAAQVDAPWPSRPGQHARQRGAGGRRCGGHPGTPPSGRAERPCRSRAAPPGQGEVEPQRAAVRRGDVGAQQRPVEPRHATAVALRLARRPDVDGARGSSRARRRARAGRRAAGGSPRPRRCSRRSTTRGAAGLAPWRASRAARPWNPAASASGRARRRPCGRRRAARAGAAWKPSRRAGVPDRRAHPGASGPWRQPDGDREPQGGDRARGAGAARRRAPGPSRSRRHATARERRPRRRPR